MSASTRPSSDASREPTLFLEARGSSGRGRGDSTSSLSPELRQQVARRLRGVALVYSLGFFLADWAPLPFVPDGSERFGHVAGWVFSVGSILLGFAVAIVAGNQRLGWNALVRMGLAFQVAGSYGIAFAMYHMVGRTPELTKEMLLVMSPSWPAVWMIFYSVIVPAPMRLALIAALASATAAPVGIAVGLAQSGMWRLLTPPEFFFSHVFPNLICVLMAVLGARVVYQLNRDVSRARELGSYRLVERLGQGGMGEVWRASHRLLARPAVVKFIRADAMAASSIEEARVMHQRFELEARATASLTSEHTVHLFDYGVTEEGVFYYVMEMLEGVDLEELVRRFGALPPARVAHLLAQVCDSLEEAHAKGLIHRDIKPANIYACRSGHRCDFIKVLDFGLVAKRASLDAADTRLTQPQQAAGTPAYMPPEVARGEAVDGRTDLYALGCVAYWLLTGRPVFTGNSVYDLVSQHLQAVPEPPSVHAPAVPKALDLIVLACLAKSPDERPADARRLGRMLHELRIEPGWNDAAAAAWWQENLARSSPGTGDDADPEDGPTSLFTAGTTERER